MFQSIKYEDKRNKMDKEIFNKAIQGYINDPQKNVPNLIEYAKTMRVWNKVKNLIGVSVLSARQLYGNAADLAGLP